MSKAWKVTVFVAIAAAACIWHQFRSGAICFIFKMPEIKTSKELNSSQCEYKG